MSDHQRLVPLTPVRVENLCPRPTCGAVMRPDGRVLMSSPPQYPHSCPACDQRATLTSRTGDIRYIDKESAS